MAFNMKYSIESKYLTPNTKRRPATPMDYVKFVVAHDTGNPNSTAIGNVTYYENSNNVMYASAQLFIDDQHIVECIPTGIINNLQAEKAWHVVYNGTKDNEIFGCEANDAAIGVEYCFGNNINADEAYAKFVWILAYICWFYNLDPSTSIIGHHLLQKGKIDPVNGLSYSGRTYEQLLEDVVKEYNECLEGDEEDMPLQLEDWTWEELDSYVGQAYNDSIIESWDWVQKVRNKELTLKELVLLKIIIDERRRLKGVIE